MATAESTERRIGTIQLAPGVTIRNVATLCIASICVACVSAFILIMQPVVLRDQLHLPAALLGRANGVLSAAENVATLVFITVFGVLADRYGRRRIYYPALIFMALALFLTPLAPVFAVVLAVRFLYGSAYTAMSVAGVALPADYPANRSRGKFIGMLTLTGWLGSAIIVQFTGARLPTWFQGLGFGAAVANRYAFWCFAALGLFGAALAFWGLKRDGPAAPASVKSAAEPKTPFWSDLRRFGSHLRTNPNLRVVVLASMVLRGDFVIIGNFLPVWVVAEVTKTGAASARALEIVGNLQLILALGAIVATLVFGFLVDRFRRSTMLAVAFGLTTISYSCTVLVHDFLAIGAFALVFLIGFAENCSLIAGAAIFGEEVPEDLRGAAASVYLLAGTLGIMALNLVGGLMFDKVSHTSPFLMVALINIVLLVLALRMRKRRDPTVVET